MKDKKNYIWIGLILLIGLIIVARSGSSETGSTGSVSVGDTYSVSSAENNLLGHAEVTASSEDSVSVEFAFVIEDPTIKNNGRCIDDVGDWCASDNGGDRVALEETKYRYGVLFESTIDDEYPAGSALEPIYCNKEEAKSNPASLILNPAEGLDTKCDGWILANWAPTSTFEVSGRSSFDSIDDFLNSDLVVFDTSALHKISYTTTATSGTVSESSVSFSDYSSQPRIKNYSLDWN